MRPGPNRRSMARSFAGYAFATSVFLAIVSVAAMTAISYKRDLLLLRQQVVDIVESHVPALVSSLWLTDFDLAQNHIERMVVFPYIGRVELRDSEGLTLVAGDLAVEDSTVEERSLVYSRRNRSVPVGTLRVYVDQASLRRQNFLAHVPDLVAGLITALVIAGAISLVFHRICGRHLSQFADHLRGTSTTIPSEPFVLDRRRETLDELSDVVTSFNQLRAAAIRRENERELLFKELRHRIKNDLSLVHSLLSLQAEQSDSESVEGALREAAGRVYVMGEIYDTYYRMKDADHVEIDVLSKALLDRLRRTIVSKAVAVDHSVESFQISTKLAVSFGIILNELVTNAVKYGGSTTSPWIGVEVSQPGQSGVRLSVADNGPGFPSDVVTGDRSGFGLTVVRALAEQHGGSYTLSGDAGARVEVQLTEPV